MIKRTLSKALLQSISEYPIVTLSGPRQSGKTTLAKMVLDGYRYVNLEDRDAAEFARMDPKGFLKTNETPLIIDEVQQVPELLSSIQVAVDANRSKMGQFVLTGSHQALLKEGISQSLAGRTALLDLLPLSLAELKGETESRSTDEIMLRGFMPELYRQNIQPSRYYRNYVRTYVERDVRLMLNIRNLSAFEKALVLLAGRIGQLVNLSSLAVEVGVSSTTLAEWISVLEASYIVKRICPWFGNVSKRLVKTPKLYFCEVGLAVHLLGIQSADQLARDPLRGNLFENMVVMDRIKSSLNADDGCQFSFLRTKAGFEIDLLEQKGRFVRPIEIKSTATARDGLSENLRRYCKESPDAQSPTLVYDGADYPARRGVTWTNFRNL